MAVSETRKCLRYSDTDIDIEYEEIAMDLILHDICFICTPWMMSIEYKFTASNVIKLHLITIYK